MNCILSNIIIQFTVLTNSNLINIDFNNGVLTNSA